MIKHRNGIHRGIKCLLEMKQFLAVFFKQNIEESM
ncbi:hypothetical protein CGLO_11743 [Colletotrichum gloeosporioides Cg-14]|uniref:Uncharacterized protein n=1 Tax=Colletotrichum gloeosporioides (strain Cg-14) TaxID=1237896 RepID=T0LB63_COLGC|nr:hypothetical protein CGLO_11743 [Colletotrichum gloeosporioides Cg-14]